MIVVNIDEQKYYEHKRGFAENIINDMFKEYFDELYQEKTVKSLMEEIWLEITMNIPKEAVFVVKDEILYYVTQNLQFEIAPKHFFEMNGSAHAVLRECFQKCFQKFQDMMTNYREFESTSIASKVNVHLESNCYWSEDFNDDLLYRKGQSFKDILKISLKEKLCNSTCLKILEIYKNALLANEPIMFITKKGCHLEEIYMVTDKLAVVKVSYFLIERELDEIINKVLPEDTDFLANRIYNLIMMPLKEVKPYVKINKVKDKGIDATLFLEEKAIPVVTDFDFNCYYAFLPVEHNTHGFPYTKSVRYPCDNTRMVVESIFPEFGLDKIQRVNETMFQNLSCYVEVPNEQYMYYKDYSDVRSGYNRVFKLNNGKCTEIIEHYHYHIKEDSPEDKKIKAESSKIKKRGCYAFYEIEFRSIEQ